MDNRFLNIYKKTLKHEGYYSFDTSDKGGETYMGISRKFFPKWEGWDIIDAEKPNNNGKLERNQKIASPKLDSLVEDFYYNNFWLRFGVNYVNNDSVAYIIFDFCVNSGKAAAYAVQYVLNENIGHHLNVDGIIGTKTLSAINSSDPEALFLAIKAKRAWFYLSCSEDPTQRKFTKGWLRRVFSFEYEEGETESKRSDGKNDGYRPKPPRK